MEGMYTLTKGEAEALAAFAAKPKDYHRDALRAISFSGERASATDSHGAITVHVTTTGEPEPVNVRAEDITRIAKTASKGRNIAVNGALINPSDGIRIEYTPVDDTFPNLDAVTPSRDDAVVSITIDANYLKRIADAAKKITGGDAMVTLHIISDKKPLLADVRPHGYQASLKVDPWATIIQMPLITRD